MSEMPWESGDFQLDPKKRAGSRKWNQGTWRIAVEGHFLVISPSLLTSELLKSRVHHRPGLAVSALPSLSLQALQPRAGLV